jgi:hypothetical protein
MQISLNLFLSFISTLTLFGNALTMPLDNAIEARQLTVQCGPLWTYIGLCRALETPTIRPILTIAPTLKAATAMTLVLSVQANMVLAQVKMLRIIAQGITARVSESSSYRLGVGVTEG